MLLKLRGFFSRVELLFISVDFSSLYSSLGPPRYNLMTGKQVKTFTIGISGSLSSRSVPAVPRKLAAADSAAFAKAMQVFVD